MTKTLTFDPVKLAAMILGIIALVSGSFTLLAVAFLVSLCSLQMTWKRWS